MKTVIDVEIALPWKGDLELERLEGALVPKLREQADRLHALYEWAAERAEKLQGAGWQLEPHCWSILCHHPEVSTIEEAEARLRSAGVDPEELSINEDECEEEFEDEEEEFEEASVE